LLVFLPYAKDRHCATGYRSAYPRPHTADYAVGPVLDRCVSGTVIVVKEVHVVPEPGNGVELVEVAVIEGQHSIVTAHFSRFVLAVVAFAKTQAQHGDRERTLQQANERNRAPRPIGWTNPGRMGDSSPLPVPARRASEYKAADIFDVPVLRRCRPRRLSRL
jgi:hypothetical protein